ncbi:MULTISPECIES: type VI secretion system protein TssA [Corallincola]|uniref:Type VI secretion system protein TssA n=2 Tax=Corallincola TaxID=1775176 RepID=A0ABY1WTX6_9GAMM|nr:MULTISPECIES: type VI secretion system protein TssA [Corallincola]TAA48083.1 type VI secretion system protein TssA [Corallincola spongiicola]TCI03235.1 type VI secretion system protein TssA [Corallincola luteus]
MDDTLLDISALIAPISEEAPTGIDPRLDVTPTSPYYTLKDVRNTARANERNALIDNESLLSLSSLWQPIADQVPELLQSHYKDLELTAWLIEALARLHGFAGLAAGFSLATHLIEDHWQQLYPSPDEEGLETRISPLIGLNGIEGEGALLMPISSIPLTPESGEFSFSLWEYEQALEVERLDDEKKRNRIDAGAVELADVLSAAKAAPKSFFLQLNRDVGNAIASFERLSMAMDAACSSPQPTSQITKRLNAAQEAVVYLAGDKLVEMPESAEERGADEELGTTSQAFGSQSHVANREQAIETLRQVAAFFKSSEPHSPMAYGIEQVVRWSDMSLPDLLSELISDGEARNGYFRLTGIPIE